MENNNKFKYIIIGMIVCFGLLFLNSMIQKGSGTEIDNNNIINEKQPVQIPYIVTEYYNRSVPYYVNETYVVQVPYTDYEIYFENVPSTKLETYIEDEPYEVEICINKNIKYNSNLESSDIECVTDKNYCNNEYLKGMVKTGCKKVCIHKEITCHAQFNNLDEANGKWKVEFYIYNFKTKEKIQNEIINFDMTAGENIKLHSKTFKVISLNLDGIANQDLMCAYKILEEGEKEVCNTVTKYQEVTKTREVKSYEKVEKQKQVIKYKEEIKTRQIEKFKTELKSRQITKYRIEYK